MRANDQTKRAAGGFAVAVRKVAGRMMGHAARFGRDESGVLIIFGLMIFVLMLMIGGMAVDLMRFETTRSKLQSTADRASLAAASLTQTLDSEAVVQDYFAKAGLSEYLQGVDVQDTFNYRRVTAQVQAEVPTMFMQLMGIEQLSSPANSTAEEQISDIEITLVLDVSGSMTNGGSQKLANLKIAASDFIDTVLAEDVEEKISISIVPFNGQVFLGNTVAAQYTLTSQHTFNTCVDFAAADFTSRAVSPSSTLTRSDVIDPWGSSGTKSKPNGVADQNYCTTDARNAVRPFLRDIPTLKAAINGLVSEGNTSIDVGMKWGLAMMDPGSQGVVAALSSGGSVPAYFSNRPFPYLQDNAGKFMIVMSDGENTDQHQIKSPYKTGVSPIYRATNGSLVIYHPGVAWSSKYFVLPVANFGLAYRSNTIGTWQATLPAGYTNLTWPEVFNYHPVNFVAQRLYGNPLVTGSTARLNMANTWIGNFRTSTAPAVKDTHLGQLCTLAKAADADIRVYTIAFEAPAAGQAALSACASDGDYYQVLDGEDATEITTVFQAIAHSISELRLTQ